MNTAEAALGPKPRGMTELGAGRPYTSQFEPDPVIEAYKRDIDRTLLRENLRRSVDERVRNLMALQRLAEEARRAGRRLVDRSCSSTKQPA